jgi:hypothetical protein
MTARVAVAAALLAAAASVPICADGRDVVKIIDFSQGSTLWPQINDGVMGGLSSGQMVTADGYASFRGTVSFDNNGGFSSVRSRPVIHDLSAMKGLVVRVRGDGKRYGFRLKNDAFFDGVSYQVEITPPAGEWVEIALPFGDFVPVYRGRHVKNHPPLDPGRIATFGFIISRQEGPFRLDIETIQALPSAAES